MKIINILGLVLLFVLFSLNLFAYEIVSYFNSTEYNHNLKQVIIDYINQSISNISISAYSFDDPDIANALINASQRGVKIRIMIDSDYWNGIIDYMDSYQNIEIYNDLKSKGYYKNSRQHHSKFLVIDYDVTSSLVANTVITGSYNFTISSYYLSYNNLLVVKNSVDIANIYIQEFNEEWGGSTFEFNLYSSRIGKEKKDPPPYYHTTENEEVYFSYSDKNKIKDRLIELINQAENVFMCMYSFSTNSEIFEVVLQNLSNKDIYGIFDGGQGLNSYSAYRVLLEQKPQNFAIENEYKILHNKYLILNYDENDLTKGIVITGSYNLSKNSEENNEENVIIIKNNPNVLKSYVRDFIYHFTKAGKSIEWLKLTSFNPTNIVAKSQTTNFFQGNNLDKVVSLMISNDSVQNYLNIISNTTNKIYFIVPSVEGTFNIISVLQNGNRDVLPCSITILESNTTILVNDGQNELVSDNPIRVKLFSATDEIPYIEVNINGIAKYFPLKNLGEYYFTEFYLDTILPLKSITNGNLVIFRYMDKYVTNIIYLPPFSFYIQKPQNITKNSYTTIKLVLNDPYNRRIRISGSGNVSLDLKSSGEISFFTGENDKIIIFITIEDDVGYSFSEYIEIPINDKEELRIYPTYVRLGQKIYIEGSFDNLYIFDKNHNKINFSKGEDEKGKYIIPFLRGSNILFLVIQEKDKRVLKKVVVSEF
ncbi:MAG: phospholipase D-like domain-containing protein [Brevinematia bacterium]